MRNLNLRNCQMANLARLTISWRALLLFSASKNYSLSLFSRSNVSQCVRFCRFYFWIWNNYRFLLVFVSILFLRIFRQAMQFWRVCNRLPGCIVACRQFLQKQMLLPSIQPDCAAYTRCYRSVRELHRTLPAIFGTRWVATLRCSRLRFAGSFRTPTIAEPPSIWAPPIIRVSWTNGKCIKCTK